MADTLDILTLAEAQSCLRQGSSTANDTTIALLVTAVSRRIDRAIGPVVTRTLTAETYDGVGTFIQLLSWPVSSVTTVVEDGTTLTTDDWYIDKEKGLLYRQNNGLDWSWAHTVSNHRDTVAVTYVAGRYADTASVDAYYKEGARLMLRHLWRSEEWNVNGLGVQDFDVPMVAFPSFSVPKAVIDWFGPLWRESSRDTAKARGGFV